MKKILFRTAAVLLFLFLIFFSMEFAVRVLFEPPSEKPALNIVNRKSPYVFSLNPDHSEISSQGLRDREFEIPKPFGVHRVLILGDSLTYGLFVEKEKTFAKELEKIMRANKKPVEVLNAGVNGYTLYNEIHYFQERGIFFEPDTVVLVFCLNDIVNPVLHWGDPEGIFKTLPPEAFPRYDQHVEKVMPELYARRSFAGNLLSRSALYRFLEKRWDLWRRRETRSQENEGRLWPVYVADESSVSLRSLEDPASPESLWVQKQLKELRESVQAYGAELHILFLPLAYQLKAGYPFFPQKELMAFCREEGLNCLDPLEEFRQKGGEALFMGRHRYHPQDVWHLSEEGHRVTAQFLADHLSLSEGEA